jgi:hypothetical protein
MSVQPTYARRAQASIPKDTNTSLAALARHEVIKTAAYYLAERRGFTPGCELQDWLAAEASINSCVDTTQSAKR